MQHRDFFQVVHLVLQLSHLSGPHSVALRILNSLTGPTGPGRLALASSHCPHSWSFSPNLPGAIPSTLMPIPPPTHPSDVNSNITSQGKAPSSSLRTGTSALASCPPRSGHFSLHVPHEHTLHIFHLVSDGSICPDPWGLSQLQ